MHTPAGSGTLWDAPGCSQDAPGRSSIRPVVFFGTEAPSNAGRYRYAGTHQNVLCYYLMGLILRIIFLAWKSLKIDD